KNILLIRRLTKIIKTTILNIIFIANYILELIQIFSNLYSYDALFNKFCTENY
ncbi:uncharacterized protein METZ01_LOCUS143654, partial [marine metagenome]